MSLRALAGGRDVSRGIARQQLKARVKVHRIQYTYVMPQDGGDEIIAAVLSTDRYEYTDAYEEQESATAATVSAAD